MGKPGAYPGVEHLKGTSIGYAPDSLTNIRLGWKGMPGNKIRKLRQQNFYNIGPWRSTLSAGETKRRTDDGRAFPASLSASLQSR
jgi:hypothetical protein